MGPMERLKVSKEGITVTNPMNTISLVESEQKKKVSMQRNPGWKAVEKAKFYISTTVPNLKKKRKKKESKEKKKRKEKRKKKYQIGTSVPVHPKSVPVQLTQKWEVS